MVIDSENKSTEKYIVKTFQTIKIEKNLIEYMKTNRIETLIVIPDMVCRACIQNLFIDLDTGVSEKRSVWFLLETVDTSLKREVISWGYPNTHVLFNLEKNIIHNSRFLSDIQIVKLDDDKVWGMTYDSQSSYVFQLFNKYFQYLTKFYLK